MDKRSVFREEVVPAAIGVGIGVGIFLLFPWFAAVMVKYLEWVAEVMK